MSDENEPLLFDRLTAEWALAHATHESVATELTRLRRTLAGIASCATACKCCAMHAEIAREALEKSP